MSISCALKNSLLKISDLKITVLVSFMHLLELGNVEMPSRISLNCPIRYTLNLGLHCNFFFYTVTFSWLTLMW